MEFLLVPLPPILEIRYEIFFIFFPHFLKTCFAFCNLLQPFWSHYLICYLHSYRVSKDDWAQQYPKIPCLRLGESPPHPTNFLSFGIISPNLLGHLCTPWCCFFFQTAIPFPHLWSKSSWHLLANASTHTVLGNNFQKSQFNIRPSGPSVILQLPQCLKIT